MASGARRHGAVSITAFIRQVGIARPPGDTNRPLKLPLATHPGSSAPFITARQVGRRRSLYDAQRKRAGGPEQSFTAAALSGATPVARLGELVPHCEIPARLSPSLREAAPPRRHYPVSLGLRPKPPRAPRVRSAARSVAFPTIFRDLILWPNFGRAALGS